MFNHQEDITVIVRSVKFYVESLGLKNHFMDHDLVTIYDTRKKGKVPNLVL